MALSAPFLPFYALARRVRRPPEWRVERALKALRPQFQSAQPPIIKSHVIDDWVTPTRVTVFLVCAHERDRPILESQLDRLMAAIRTELKQQEAPEVIAHGLQLQTVSKESIDRAGSFHNYFH